MTGFARAFAGLLFLAFGPVAPPARAAEAAPIECWWRTAATAVRVGERFSLILTCAIVETPSMIVVADQSSLDPAVVHVAPFEVVTGRRAADLRSGERRFFQYEYSLRMMSNDFFGKEVAIPPVQIAYHSRVPVRGEMIEGLTHTYILPPIQVRVLSLVPPGVTGIRDAPDAAFGQIEARRFRANVLQIAAVVLLSVTVACIGGAAASGLRRLSMATDALPFISGRRALSGAIRELEAIGRERDLAGWSDALVARAAAALRIGGAYAISRRIAFCAAPDGVAPQAGQLAIVTHRWRAPRQGQRLFASAPTTVAGLAGSDESTNGRRQPIGELQAALREVSAVHYGRNTTLDADALDGALATGTSALRRLAAASRWPMKAIETLRAWYA
jgi:hypothetical protein